MTKPTPTQIADTFVTVLKTWLTEEEFAEMIAANEAEQIEGICHSHDYCDGNEAMIHAMVQHGVEDMDDQYNLWEEVWMAAEPMIGRK